MTYISEYLGTILQSFNKAQMPAEVQEFIMSDIVDYNLGHYKQFIEGSVKWEKLQSAETLNFVNTRMHPSDYYVSPTVELYFWVSERWSIVTMDLKEHVRREIFWDMYTEHLKQFRHLIELHTDIANTPRSNKWEVITKVGELNGKFRTLSEEFARTQHDLLQGLKFFRIDPSVFVYQISLGPDGMKYWGVPDGVVPYDLEFSRDMVYKHEMSCTNDNCNSKEGHADRTFITDKPIGAVQSSPPFTPQYLSKQLNDQDLFEYKMAMHAQRFYERHSR